MRAFAFTAFGSAPEIHDITLPEPGEGEVRVRVRAASVNGFDLSVASSQLQGMMEHRFPVVLGKDFAGTIDAVGAGVTGYAPGDRVFGVVTKAHLGDGAFGEYVTVPVAVGLAHLPASVEFAEGAALGLAGTAALMAVEGATLQAGQTVLVAGATGGVGNQAVQLAARAGARVIATAHSDEERQLVTGLGAAEVVDYTEDVAAAVLAAHAEGVDAVLHFAGDPTVLLPAVRQGGRFVSTRIMSPDQLPAEGVTVVPIYANPTPDTLQQLAANQATGQTSVAIQRTFALDEAPAAFAAFAGGTLGKLVVVID
jgi:NADPH:quinone reductase-like Zn-dependent oxidoreductase